MNKWDQVKEEWLIGTRPYYRGETVTIENKRGEFSLCKIWYNKKKELCLVTVLDGIAYKDENLIKNLVRTTGGKVRTLTGIKLI